MTSGAFPAANALRQIILEGGLVIFPVHFDAGIGLLEAGDGALDVIIEGRRQPEGPEGDLGIRLDTLDHGFRVGARRGRDDDLLLDLFRHYHFFGHFLHDFLRDRQWVSALRGGRAGGCQHTHNQHT